MGVGEKEKMKEGVCLLVIDVQEPFHDVVKGAFPHFAGNLERLLTICREEDIRIIHIRADYNKSHSEWMDYWEYLNSQSGVGLCGDIQPDCPCEFAKELPGEQIVAKPFFDAFFHTNLEEILKQHNIKHVIVAGIVTSCCVLFTASGAFARGFRVTVVEDCV